MSVVAVLHNVMSTIYVEYKKNNYILHVYFGQITSMTEYLLME